MTEPLLVVEYLTKTFGRGHAEATAVADVSFALAPGGSSASSANPAPARRPRHG